MPTKSELASAANLHCPLLSLSNEIITSIVYQLHPREAIFLSLTCRALYHGVLSDKNHYMWYRVGRFSTSMPGLKAEWMLGKGLDQIMKGPAQKQPPPVNSNSDSAADENEPSAAAKREKKPAAKKLTRKELVTAVRTYSAGEVVVDYKKMLVDTMIGDTDTGCQWCLAKPLTRKIFKSWKLRLCEGCFSENSITKNACKPLEIDISHLPVQDVKRVWKPAVQRLANAKFGDTKPIAERMVEDLEMYRERHFVAIFEEIKRQYQELYERHERMGFTEQPFGRILEKITPQHLQLDWFMKPRRDGRYVSMQSWRWPRFLSNDPLMKELKSAMGREKWNDATWVQEKAREKIAVMQESLSLRGTHMFYYWDIPKLYMRHKVNAITKQWHIKRALEGGVDELVTRMVAQNGKGIACPWAHWCNKSYIWQPSATLAIFIGHLQMCHRDIFMLGDTDWLVGRPSRWWLKNAVQNGEPGVSQEDEKDGTACSSQVTWLQTWWPERWNEEHLQVLQGWRDNGGFYGESSGW